MVPNIVHFIYLTGKMARPFSLINYIAVRAAFDHLHPACIMFHIDQEPENNEWWERARPFIIINKMMPPTEIEGQPLDYVQYKADVLRIDVLARYGGIYLDTDMICIKPFDAILKNDFVIGIQSHDHNGEIESFCAGVIISSPNHWFLHEWKRRIPEGLKTGIWAHHCVNTPVDIWKERKPEDIQVLSRDVFMPFGIDRNYLFEEPAVSIPHETLAIHVWETFWRDYLKHVTPDFIRTSNCLFAQISKRYLF